MSDLREGFEAWADVQGFDTVRYAKPDNGPATRYTGQYQNEILQFAWEAIAYLRQHDGHAEFVRAVLDIIWNGPNSDVAALCAIEVLCAAELAKEQP